MKKILLFSLLFIASFAFGQSLIVHIDAETLLFNKSFNKLYVAVNENDPSYPNSILELNPYTGEVLRSIALSSSLKEMKQSGDHSTLFFTYKNESKLDKLDIESFEIYTILEVGELSITDFHSSPIDKDIIFIITSDNGYPIHVKMYKNGVLQAKSFQPNTMMTEIGMKSDGSQLYLHNGGSTAFDGFLLDVVEDGIITDSIIWDEMIRSFGPIKNNNDLLYGSSGCVIDAFSDSIIMPVARLEVYRVADHNSIGGYTFSTIHNAYIFVHEVNDKGYLSFFHGDFYNYLGSIELATHNVYLRELEVIDENHFVLITRTAKADSRHILFFEAPDHIKYPLQLKVNEESYDDRWN